MTVHETERVDEHCLDCDRIADIVHAISQPLTALEVGLEISLRQDKDVAQLRSRVQAALEIARTLHERLVRLRRLANAKDQEFFAER